MVKRTIILPTRDNDGASLRAEIAECRRELLSIAGGFTSYATLGEWLGGDGARYRDRGRAFAVVLDAGADLELVSILPSWCARLRQAAIYTDFAACDVAFVTAP